MESETENSPTHENSEEAVDEVDLDGKTNTRENLIESFKQLKRLILFAVGQYALRLPGEYDSTQTNLLATECLSKIPSAIHCLEYLERGADPNAIIGDGLLRPLHAVARKANVLLLQCLVEAGADINAQNARNQTPLILACDSSRTDSSYLSVIRYLVRRPDSKLNLRDVGGNTALLNGIYRNNVWITRELLLAGAQLTIGEGSPCDISLFIFAESLHTDAQNLPESVLNPWNKSCMSNIFSFRGRYDYYFMVLLQLCTNSDISMVYRMINYRRLELESEGIQLKLFHPIGTRSPEQLELEEQLRRQEEKKSSRRKLRETRERERWEGVLRGIEEKVNQEYGFRNYFIKNEPKQTWMPMRQEVKSNSEGAVRDYDLMGREVSNSDSEVSPGKRWKVVEVKKQGVYSRNPYPGARDAASKLAK